ncbi:MAG: hypothetical protein QMD85_02870, partial [Candidatus Aenigmarchaeota archaeon]|nr:hypothetical protein [Candidatus Aenigmarchaeota archaeon]MDI6722491.1 hypothetical protein [Candidatus Aenigmarchaeota archaeon]
MRQLDKAAAYALVIGSLSFLPGCDRKDTASRQYHVSEHQADTTLTAEKPAYDCKSSVYQVRSGIIKPEAYFQDLEHCLPDVIEAKKSGILKGILYNPSDEKLQVLLREMFFGRTDVDALVQSSLAAYKGARGEEVGTLIPEILGTFGQKFPLYLVLKEELFSVFISLTVANFQGKCINLS